MSVPVKRKRGRPRLDEPRENTNFDNNLIQEFKKCPIFYDRQHPQYRNREYTDPVWQRISQTLNVSMNLVKTRMSQLRSRFNLEKRRLEFLKEQQVSATSQWSLYENLAFLSSHVKTRRPYSIPVGYNPKANSTSSSDGETDDDEEVEGNKAQSRALNTNHILTNGNDLSNKKKSDGLSANQNHLSDNSAALQHGERSIFRPVEANKDFGSKYDAFGQFLASSLIEMNDIQALNLVDKFTIDLVKYLKIEERKKHFNNVSQRSITDGDEENSLTVY